MQAGKRNGLVTGVFLVFFMLRAFAHGDVTPRPIDTASLNPIGKEWVPTNPYRGNAKAVEVGAEGYMHNCAGCHGLNVESGGMAPDLLKLAADCVGMTDKSKQEACYADTDEYFKGITLNGKKNSEGRYTMPAYNAVFTQEAVWAVKAYIDSRTSEEANKTSH